MPVEFMVAALRVIAAVLLIAFLCPRLLQPSKWRTGWKRGLTLATQGGRSGAIPQDKKDNA
ncbi:MAG: hypothetical protein AAF405_04930 [Pseudomonadota bacterium]